MVTTRRASGDDPAGHVQLRRAVVSLLVLTFLLGLGGKASPARAAVPGLPPFAWTVERVVTQGDAGWYSSIALDGLGNPYIAYVDGTNGTFNVVHQVNGTWVPERVDGPGTFEGNTNIAVAPNGTVQVAYYDDGAKAVKYAVRETTGWHVTIVDNALPGGYVRMALASTGRPVLVYVSYQAQVRYATWNGTGWTHEIIDDTAVLPRYVDVVLDASNQPHVSYYADGTLRYATKASGAWLRQVADPTLSAGWFSRICLDNLGVPDIAYYDSVNLTLRWATDLNGHWTHTVLDGSGDSGWDLSLSTDADGHAQIAYYSRLLGSLRFAVNTTLGWVLETVDLGGVVGWYTGIATDASGHPHISYYDWTDGDLKYAVGRIGLQARTLGVLGLTTPSVTLQGELVALGNHTFADVGFSYRAAGAPAWSSVPLRAASTAGAFRATLTNLTAGDTYEFRAEASADNETSLGDVLTFHVSQPALPPPPYLEIAAAGGAAAAIALVLFYVRMRRKRKTQTNVR